MWFSKKSSNCYSFVLYDVYDENEKITEENFDETYFYMTTFKSNSLNQNNSDEYKKYSDEYLINDYEKKIDNGGTWAHTKILQGKDLHKIKESEINIVKINNKNKSLANHIHDENVNIALLWKIIENIKKK